MAHVIMYHVKLKSASTEFEASELEFERIQTQMTQKPMLRAEVGMRVRSANKASAENSKLRKDHHHHYILGTRNGEKLLSFCVLASGVCLLNFKKIDE